jgi:hypothetical protein
MMTQKENFTYTYPEQNANYRSKNSTPGRTTYTRANIDNGVMMIVLIVERTTLVLKYSY